MDEFSRHIGETGLDDLDQLRVRISLERDPVQTESRGDFVGQGSFWQVHCICHGQNDETRMPKTGPVEEIIHYALILCDELIEFVHEDDAGDPPGTGR